MYSCTSLGIGPEKRKIFEYFHSFDRDQKGSFILEVPGKAPFVDEFARFLKFFACNNIGVVLEIPDRSLMLVHVKRQGVRGSCSVYGYPVNDLELPWSDAIERLKTNIDKIENITVYRQISENKWQMV